jgi:septal ring factor EnvC (AmiA/AmiB activator)
MTRSSSNKKLIARASRGLVALGLLGTGCIAAAQDAATRYAQMLSNAEITKRFDATIQQQLASQQREVAALEQQIAEIDATAAALQPMLQRMFDDLVEFVQADVPFLAKERAARVDRLRDVMSQLETPPGEKYRRLLEAYTIEMEYGRTMDAYREMMSDGREADFVRLGRVTLMYRTVDGSESGYWDNQRKTWVAAPEYSRAIEEALQIAKQETAPDVITVPAPAPGARS